MSTFSVTDWLDAYQPGSSTVKMSQPEEVTCWTKTGVHHGSTFLFGDRSGLPTYTRPSLPVDLNEGYPQSYTAKQEGQRSPVDTIVQAAQAVQLDWHAFDVVTYRNNLNKILTTAIPGMGDDAWQLDCCYMQDVGTMFLDIVPGPQRFNAPERFTYYGYKFEAVCTGEALVDATSEFASVVAYRLGALQVLMAAEVDAALPVEPDDPPHYVEMKTYGIPRHAKAAGDMYAKKHPRWWVQSYLAGVPTMVLGGREPSGRLIKVQEVPVQALPGLSAHSGHAWDPQLMLAFGEAVLLWLKGTTSKYPDQQLQASFNPGSNCIQCEVVAGGDMPDRLQQLLPGS